ncbi:hypothetical protein L916_20905 [Phytophthora nicotianae]|uniref:Uncharacterized protein n=1 Tax=Phytophthora nicotianae TaxID=4792 RepID=W2HTE9_PHYNI|nr:hypothetical protein L916_20905 [Phytophthora nicotianae]
MPRRQPHPSDESDEDQVNVAYRSNSDSESCDSSAHFNSRKKKKRLRRRPSAPDRPKSKRRKQTPHHISSRHHKSTRRRNEKNIEQAGLVGRTELDEESPSSLASESDASNQYSSGSEAEGLDGGGIAPLDELVGVPELDVTAFDTWDALESYLKAYSKKTFQVCIIRLDCEPV